MKFTKMHGAGNDYVYIDCFREKVSNPAELAKRMSHRRYGVGSDGLILIRPFKDGDAEMVMYNADGSQAEMCGNGLRCVAKYVHDRYVPGKKELKILTGRGPLTAEIHAGDDGMAESVSLDMGEPILEGAQIPVNIDKPRILKAGFPVEEIGKAIEKHALFPSRVNVEFVQYVSQKELIQRTWERGSGETWACGTGAAAVAVVSVLTGRTGNSMTIHLLGGDLELEYTEGSTVNLKGPAVEVFQGEWRE
jgi:diaminopimelate epimerase